MKRRLFITSQARRQLENNYGWWKTNRSLEQAVRWYNGFLDAIESLIEDAERCPLAPENDAFQNEIRQLPFGLGRRPTHRAVFFTRDDIVYIFSIRHLAQDAISPEDI